MAKKSVQERLLEKIHIPETACWVWTGADNGKGYGKISVDGKMRYSHIVSYELVYGPVEEGMVLDHKCRNRLCCNPDHLKPIPGKINTLIGEGPTAQNALKTHCLRGHPLSGDNLIKRSDGRRECKACKRIRRR